MSARAISFRKISRPRGFDKSSETQNTLRRSWIKVVATVDLPSLAREPDADIAPSDVADSRPLDLDHFRAHFGRQFGGERLRDQGPGRDDLHALQRAELFSDEIFDAHGFGDDAGFCVEAGNTKDAAAS